MTVTATAVTQDEPIVDGVCPDAQITGGVAYLAGERSPGSNGRVYVVSFTATDGKGGSCSGSVTVCVPSPSLQCIDDGQIYNSRPRTSAIS